MERRGIISVGNWLVDSVKFVDTYPSKGMLTNIRKVEEGLGGCSHNVLVDLAALNTGLPLYAGGCIGNDKYGRMVLDACDKYGINRENIKVLENVPTSYTDVMSEIGGSATRTFFHCYGANAELREKDVLACNTGARIFHLGYLLLLPELDKEDSEYGVVAARTLKCLQEKGYETSVDVVSEEGERFRKVVLPCRKYTDYLIINEVEAGACLGVDLRNADGTVDTERVRTAAHDLMRGTDMKICVIHYPEGGFACSGPGRKECFIKSEMLPPDEIVSAVGAGDAFCAGVLYSIHEGWEMEKMLRFATVCARMNLRSPTSTGGAASLKEITDIMETLNTNE